MWPKERHENLRNALIESITFVAGHRQSKDWLPIKASALLHPEDVGVDSLMLEHCMVKEIFDSGECWATTLHSGTDAPYGLNEFLTDNLIEIWETYTLNSVEQSIWKENAIEYMKANSDYPEERISSLIDKYWCTEKLFCDNLAFIRDSEDKLKYTNANKKELWIFAYPIERFQRDASDKEVVSDYEENVSSDDPVRKMDLLDFTTLINDEMFSDTDYWVRAIELPLDE